MCIRDRIYTTTLCWWNAEVVLPQGIETGLYTALNRVSRVYVLKRIYIRTTIVSCWNVEVVLPQGKETGLFTALIRVSRLYVLHRIYTTTLCWCCLLYTSRCV